MICSPIISRAANFEGQILTSSLIIVITTIDIIHGGLVVQQLIRQLLFGVFFYDGFAANSLLLLPAKRLLL